MISRLEGISKTYRRADRSFQVFQDCSLAVEQGEFLILSGHSGSGKSTLLALIGGYLKPDGGEVFFEDQNLSLLQEKGLAKLHAGQIGYLPQSNVMVSEFTILENVMLKGLLLGEEGKKEEAMELLRLLGIETLAQRFPHELSGGELRRAAIARLLLDKPRLYLLDEPSGGLDKESIRVVMNCLEERRREGATIIVATHDDLVTEYGSRIYDLGA